jgi:hypothetical protein
VTKAGPTKNLPRLLLVIYISFPNWVFFLPNWLNEYTQMLIRYVRISSFSASRVRSWDSVQIVCRSRANSQNSEFCASYV